MKTYFKLAWRNLWRNKRRTLITVASIFFGVLLSAFMSSMQEGSYEHMIDNIVKFYSGHIQIHKNGYWKEKNFDNNFVANDSLKQAIEEIGEINLTTPRIESYSLASSGEITKAAIITGIHPSTENKITKISDKVAEGRYLKDGENGVVIGGDLAKYLKLELHDTLVLVGQGYRGITAANMFPVIGILNHPSPQLNRLLVYMDIDICREFFWAYSGDPYAQEYPLTSSLVIMIDNNDKLTDVKEKLNSKLSNYYEVMTWEEMQPVIVQQVESDRAGGSIMKGILYLIIGFGILGTIMMMIVERKREFGVVIAIGMQRYKLSIILMTETILISFLGVVSGLLVSIPLNTFFYFNPIPLKGEAAEMMLEYGFEPVMWFSLDPPVFYMQAVTVFIISLGVIIYPLISISKLNINNALRA